MLSEFFLSILTLKFRNHLYIFNYDASSIPGVLQTFWYTPRQGFLAVANLSEKLSAYVMFLVYYM